MDTLLNISIILDPYRFYTGVLISPQPDHEGNKRPKSGFIQHTPLEAQHTLEMVCSQTQLYHLRCI